MRANGRSQPVIFACKLLLFLLFITSGRVVPPVFAAEEPRGLFSIGSGPAEVIIFTDYFCPPCQAVEPYLEKALNDLYRSGFKITFVDKPINPKTPLYSRYFLYATNTAPDFEEMLRIRRVLFETAKTNTVESESQLLRHLKENDIRMGLLDVRPVFNKWMELIGRFEIRSTPTCVLVRPGHESLILKGSREIPRGIDRLLQEISMAPEAK